MEQDLINFRAARPTLEEGMVFAGYLDQAAEGFFHLLLGAGASGIIATAYTEPDHEFSYQNVTFAERNEVIVGMISGFSAEQHHRSPELPFKLTSWRSALRFAMVKLLCAPLLRFLDTIQAGDFYLQAIAVDSDQRGEGIGWRLIDFIEERATSIGAARLVLDVAAKNKNARRLYERRGMTVEKQWPGRLKIPQFRIVRMTRELRSHASSPGNPGSENA